MQKVLVVDIDHVYAHARRRSMGFIDSRKSGEELTELAGLSVFHSIPPPQWAPDEYYVGVDEDRELYHMALQELAVLLKTATHKALDTFISPTVPYQGNIRDMMLLLLVQGA